MIRNKNKFELVGIITDIQTVCEDVYNVTIFTSEMRQKKRCEQTTVCRLYGTFPFIKLNAKVRAVGFLDCIEDDTTKIKIPLVLIKLIKPISDNLGYTYKEVWDYMEQNDNTLEVASSQ